MLGSSNGARGDADLARGPQREQHRRGALPMAAGSRIEGRTFVTMSSESGPVRGRPSVNDLDQPITRRVARGHRRLGPDDRRRPSRSPSALDGGASCGSSATAQDIGVHAVTLLPPTPPGCPSAQTRFSVRAEQVSTVIWVIIGVGVGLLLVAIVVRLVRRIRRRVGAADRARPARSTA